jgi:hypothetical protein
MIAFLKSLITSVLRWFQETFGRLLHGDSGRDPATEPTPIGILLLDLEIDESVECPGPNAKRAFRLQEHMDCSLVVTVRIRFTRFDPSPLLLPWTDADFTHFEDRKNEWKRLIETYWSDQYHLRWTEDLLPPHRADDRLNYPHCDIYRVSCRVEWVDSNEHHLVSVSRGLGSFDQFNWFLGEAGREGYVESAAHEYGHMLGLCHDTTPEESIMTPGTPGHTVFPHHYKVFAELLTRHKPYEYVVKAE